MKRKSKRKRILIAMAGGIVVSVVAIFLLLNLYLPSKVDPDIVLEFIKQNPEKASFTMLSNQELLVEYQSDRAMPLASVAKIIVAVEYAEQAAQNKIDPDQMVSLDELNRYYIPKLDGGAQEEWEQSLKSVIDHSSVPLREVVKGMISFSSNANMEYLMEILGVDSINLNLEKLGLHSHEPLYPFYSSLFIPYLLMTDYEDMTDKEKIIRVKKELEKMPQERFQELAMEVHERLREDSDGSYQQEVQIEHWYDDELDKINSDRLVSATAADYGMLLSKINSRDYFAPEAQTYLDEVMETAMESEGNKEQFEHLGFKGGSTNYIMNSAIYAIDKKGNHSEIVLFMNNLSKEEMEHLSRHLNEFLFHALTSDEYQTKLSKVLAEGGMEGE
jgi:D-alanyl-D-alanine carboxypeptidase